MEIYSQSTIDGDAADDPAIWAHPTHPHLSAIIGADKKLAGWRLHDLSGHDACRLQAPTAR
ncbi:phytase [Caulobacter segnis]